MTLPPAVGAQVQRGVRPLVERLRRYVDPAWGSALRDMHDAAEELERLEMILSRYQESWSALRDWAQECRDQVLYPAAQSEGELGRTADGLGQASVGLLRELAAEPQGEPVAYGLLKPDGSIDTELIGTYADCEYWSRAEREEQHGWKITPIYIHPPQRVPLTDEQIDAITRATVGEAHAAYRKIGRAIERAHGIGPGEAPEAPA